MKELDYYLLELSFNDNIQGALFIKELKKSIAGCKFTLNELLEYCPNKEFVLELLDPNYEEFLQLFYYKRVSKDLDKLEYIFSGLPYKLKLFALLSMPHIFPDDIFLKYFKLFLSDNYESVINYIKHFSNDFSMNYQLYFFSNINNLFISSPDLLYFYVNLYLASPSEFKQIQFNKLNLEVLLYFLNYLPFYIFEPMYFHYYVSFKKSVITKKELKEVLDVFLKSIKNESRLKSFKNSRNNYVFRATISDILNVFYTPIEIKKLLNS